MEKIRPLISVCVPVYNNETYIRGTLQSVVQQTYSNWELIVVDNCSTDRTFEILNQFIREQNDPRIRILRQPRNVGAPANFNRAIREANGQFAKLLCGDDLLYPTCLEKQVSAFQNQDPLFPLSLVCSKRDFMDDQGKKLFVGHGFKGKDRVLLREQALKAMVRAGTNLIGEPASGLFRTELFHKIGGFDENQAYLIDVDFWCRLLSEGSLHFIAEPLYAFRIARRSWSASLGKSQASQTQIFFTSLFLKNPDCISKQDLRLGTFKSKIFSYLRQTIYLYLKYSR